MNLRIGIFGGTFDPIHFGHINLALNMQEKHSLDQIWWVITNSNPFKKKLITPALKRLEMLKLALLPFKNFKIITLELENLKPSYTIDTLKKLHQEQKDNKQFFLILGEDLVENFFSWKEPEEILKLAKPLVGSRFLKKKFDLATLPVNYQLIFLKGWTKLSLLDISSTQIRKRLKEKLYCGHLTDIKVLDYITLNHLY